MAGSPFEADAGTYQGRIFSAAATQGSYVYELGHALPGRLYTFAVNSSHALSQTADVTGIAAIRVAPVIRGITTMPAGAAWTVRLKIDGIVRASRTIDSRSVTLTDIALNLHGAGLTGNHAIGFDLIIQGGTGPYEAELPGVSVDAIVADEVGVALELVNRNPQPGETGVPVGGPFSLDVESTAGAAAPDLAATTITVDGVLVYDGSTFQDGWTSSAVDATVSSGWRFTLSPDAPITPSAAHQIAVVSALVGGQAASLQTSWMFSTVDTVAPAVLDAFALRERQVRVTFSEAVKQASALGADDALNPANYTLALLDGWPAVTPSILSVETDGADRVILTLGSTGTRGAVYNVTVTGVVDLHGNAVADPTNVAAFVGFSFPVPAARDFNLYRRWVTADQKAQETGDQLTLYAIWQEPIDLLLGIIDKIADIYDPDLAPEPFLDVMLVEMGNPFDFPLTENEKRRLVQILVPIYQSKGTGPGIVDAIRLFMGIEVTLNVYAWSPVGLGEAIMGETWILGSSDPQDLLTFQVLVPQVLTDAERRKMSSIIDYMMDTRELFVLLEPQEIVTPDHWQMGYSQLGVNTYLH